jgi:hypothetical protein
VDHLSSLVNTVISGVLLCGTSPFCDFRYVAISRKSLELHNAAECGSIRIGQDSAKGMRDRLVRKRVFQLGYHLGTD